MIPVISIISVFYDCDRFLPGFFENITKQSAFNKCELIYLRPDSSPGNEKICAEIWHTKFPQHIRGVSTTYDPGLYELWNLGISIANGRYITNANPDDRRAPEHIARAVEFLDKHPEFDICVTALACTSDAVPNWEVSKRDANWFTEIDGEFTVADLFEYSDDAERNLCSRNLPHCMPVWRKSLHERFGMFEEKFYGPSADWEFWLRVLAGGARAYMINEVLGLYYFNPQSYWRINVDAHEFDKLILSKYKTYAKPAPIAITNSSQSLGLINVTNALNSEFGRHRHGWAEAIRALVPLDAANGVLLEPFIEKKFHYGTDLGDFHSICPSAYTSPWVGFLHCTEDTPEWFSKWLKPTSIFETTMWQTSLPYCKGLFVLSTDAAQWLRGWIAKSINPRIPVSFLFHPTELDVKKFEWSRFQYSPKVIQVGHWARKLNAIYFLDTPWTRVLLRKGIDNLPQVEIEMFNLDLNTQRASGVEIFDSVSNSEYDDLLMSSVVFCNLYTAAANNVVLECISRNTPILVNKIPATSEYLGKDYPLLFSDLTEASLHLRDIGRIKAAHEYLIAMDKHPFGYEAFLTAFTESDVYRKLDKISKIGGDKNLTGSGTH